MVLISFDCPCGSHFTVSAECLLFGNHVTTLDVPDLCTMCGIH